MPNANRSPNGWRATRTIRLNLPERKADIMEGFSPNVRAAIILLGFEVALRDPEALREKLDQVRLARQVANRNPRRQEPPQRTPTDDSASP